MYLILAVLLPPAVAFPLMPWLAFRHPAPKYPRWPAVRPVRASDRVARHRLTWWAESADWCHLLWIVFQTNHIYPMGVTQ